MSISFYMANAPTYIKQWRQYRGLTQQQVADALDTSKGYVSDMERGARRYNQDILEALAKLFRCQPGDILALDPTKPIDSLSALEYLKSILGESGVSEVRDFVKFKAAQDSN